MENRVICEEMLLAFQKYLQENEKSEVTIGKYRRDICCFVKYVAKQTECNVQEKPTSHESEKISLHINKSLVLAYKAYLEKKYAVASANSMIAALNSFLRFVGWSDLCVKQFKIQKNAYCSEEKELTKAEYNALVRTAQAKKNERLALVIQSICGTGIRVSELQYITVEAVKKGEALVSCKGKNRKIFIVAALRKKLLQYAMERKIVNGEIFVTRTGKTLSRSNIWREMKSLCEQAGVLADKVFPHNLRHLFARIFYGIEKDIVKLADVLGHSNINTTRIYTITTGEEHRRLMESMRLII